MLNSFHPALGFSLAQIIFYKITDNETRKTGLARASRCCRQSKMHNLHPQSGLDIQQIVFTFILTKQLSAARRHLATPSAFMNFPIHLISSKHECKSYRKNAETRVTLPFMRLDYMPAPDPIKFYCITLMASRRIQLRASKCQFPWTQLINIVNHDAAQNISMLHSPNPFQRCNKSFC